MVMQSFQKKAGTGTLRDCGKGSRASCTASSIIAVREERGLSWPGNAWKNLSLMVFSAPPTF